jgi:hypothetical protein
LLLLLLLLAYYHYHYHLYLFIIIIILFIYFLFLPSYSLLSLIFEIFDLMFSDCVSFLAYPNLFEIKGFVVVVAFLHFEVLILNFYHKYLRELYSFFNFWCRCGKYPPVVKTAVPVDGRFEHIVMSCNATRDHAIISVQREAQLALDVSHYHTFWFISSYKCLLKLLLI